MNCPFCGTTLVKVAAICPSCKIQLPEAQLFSYYAAALVRDRSLAQPEKRAKLDSLVKVEAEAREKLLAEARERARIEDERAAAQRQKEAEEYRARQAVVAQEMRQKREDFWDRNGTKVKLLSSLLALLLVGVFGATYFFNQRDLDDSISTSAQEEKLEPCVALGAAAKDINVLLNGTLERYRDGGLSAGDLKSIGRSAIDIQAELLSKTTGQTLNQPELESQIIYLGSSLSVYSESLRGLNSEEEIITKATNPLQKLTVRSQRLCQSKGYGNQFMDASGWEK